MLLNGYDFSTGDPDGGTEQALDGLGKNMFRRITLKNIAKAANPIILHKKLLINPFRRSKTLRKVALVGAAGAAAYFGGPLLMAAGKKLLSSGAAPAAVASSDSAQSYQPEPEYAGSIGSDGEAAATVPGSSSMFTPNFLNTTASVLSSGNKIAASTRKAKVSDVPGDMGQDYTSNAESGDGLMSSKNMIIAGGAVAVLAVIFFMSKRK